MTENRPMLIEVRVCPEHPKEQHLHGRDDDGGDEDTRKIASMILFDQSTLSRRYLGESKIGGQKRPCLSSTCLVGILNEHPFCLQNSDGLSGTELCQKMISTSS